MRATVRAAITVLIVVQAAVIGVTVTTGSAVLACLAELTVLALALVLAVIVRYSTLRSQYAAAHREAAKSAERQQLCDSVHDLIGHELGLIALAAGTLELSDDDTTATRAGAIRRRAADAVATLHDTVRSLHGAPPEQSGPTDPGSLDDVIRRFRAAGGAVCVSGQATWPPHVQVATTALVREGLTNAARHAPGRPVRVHLTTVDGVACATVITELSSSATVSDEIGYGISAQRRRVAALKGSVEVTVEGGEHRLTARVPTASPTADEPASPRPSIRTTCVNVVRAAVVPAVIATAVVIVFYTWATQNATVENADTVPVGTARSVATGALPSRQAPIRLVRPPGHPTGWECRFYSNGNFPLGVATVQICFDGQRVVRVTDLAAIPLL